jgi:hypothetical protein
MLIKIPAIMELYGIIGDEMMKNEKSDGVQCYRRGTMFPRLQLLVSYEKFNYYYFFLL